MEGDPDANGYVNQWGLSRKVRPMLETYHYPSHIVP